jgi:hypothetical protein
MVHIDAWQNGFFYIPEKYNQKTSKSLKQKNKNCIFTYSLNPENTRINGKQLKTLKSS